MLIVVLALVQQRRVVVREHWTAEMKSRQLSRWRLRRRLFWLCWLVLAVFSAFYVLTFLANVSAADAAKWLESTGMSLLQDVVLKPLLLALGYATLTTLVLCCSPRVKDTILNQWIQADDDLQCDPDVTNRDDKPGSVNEGEHESSPSVFERQREVVHCVYLDEDEHGSSQSVCEREVVSAVI